MGEYKHYQSADALDRSKYLERRKLYDELFDKLKLPRENREYPHRDLGFLEQMAAAGTDPSVSVPITNSLKSGGILGSGITMRGNSQIGNHYAEVFPQDDLIYFRGLRGLAEAYKKAYHDSPEWFQNPDKFFSGIPFARTHFVDQVNPYKSTVQGQYNQTNVNHGYGDKSLLVENKAYMADNDPLGILIHEGEHFRQNERANPHLPYHGTGKTLGDFANGKEMREFFRQGEEYNNNYVRQNQELSRTRVPSAMSWSGQEDNFSEIMAEHLRLLGSQPSKKK